MTQGRPFGVVFLDTTSGKMYWSIWNPGKIRRANLDGTNASEDREYIRIERARRWLIWILSAHARYIGPEQLPANKIQRAATWMGHYIEEPRYC